MVHPKGKTSAEVSGVPGWCYRCKVREGPKCQMYQKPCVDARADNDCIRRPKVDRISSCSGSELGSMRGLYRNEVDPFYTSRLIFDNKNRKKDPIRVDLR